MCQICFRSCPMQSCPTAIHQRSFPTVSLSLTVQQLMINHCVCGLGNSKSPQVTKMVWFEHMPCFVTIPVQSCANQPLGSIVAHSFPILFLAHKVLLQCRLNELQYIFQTVFLTPTVAFVESSVLHFTHPMRTWRRIRFHRPYFRHK